MLTGKFPYDSKNNKALMKKIVRNHMVFPRNIDPKYVIILKAMLNKNPKKRPNVSELIHFMINN
jgi:serine/threonine protein kinase